MPFPLASPRSHAFGCDDSDDLEPDDTLHSLQVTKVSSQSMLLQELGEELSNHLPIVDLSNFQVGISRLHGANWDSEAEVCDNVSSVDMRSKIMDGQRRASFVIEMSYSFV